MIIIQLNHILLNICGVVMAAIEVSATPKWTTKPLNTTYALLGSTAYLSWGFDAGNDTLVVGRWGPEEGNIIRVLYVSWIQGDAPVIHKENDVDFINNGTLVLHNVSLDDSGSYRCELNFKKSTLFYAAQLTIVDLQVLDSTPEMQTAREHENLTVVMYVAGSTLPQVVWLKDGHPIDPLSFTPSVSGAGLTDEKMVYRVTLSAYNITRNVSGFYQVQTNYVGTRNEIFGSVHVKVKYSPGDSTKFSADKTIARDSSRVMLVCSAISFPVSWYTISKDGNILKNDMTGIHVIEAMTFEDEGIYECQPTNEMGVGTKRITNVAYGVPPVFMGTFSSYEVTSLENFTFNCQAEGRPTPLLSIKRNGRQVSIDGKKFYLNQTTSGVLTVVTLTAQLGPPFTEDGGYYTCQASNELGEASLAVQLTVFYPPVFDPDGVPMNVTGMRGRSASLECSASAQPGPLLYTWYFNDQPLGSHTNLTFGTLPFSNLSDSHEGWYTCLVANGRTYTKATAYVTVNDDSENGQIWALAGYSDDTLWIIPLLAAVLSIIIVLSIVLSCWRRKSLQRARFAMRDESDTTKARTDQSLDAHQCLSTDASKTKALPVHPVPLPRITRVTRQAPNGHHVYLPTDEEIKAGKEEIEVVLHFEQDTSEQDNDVKTSKNAAINYAFEDDLKTKKFLKDSSKVDLLNRAQLGPRFIPALECHYGSSDENRQEHVRKNVETYVDSLFDF